MNIKNIIILIIVIAVIVVGYLLLKQSPENTSEALEQELNEIDLGDIDSEFELIDQDLEEL